MPDYTIDQADEAKTAAEVADDSDAPAPGIERVREDLSGMAVLVEGNPGPLGFRTMAQAIAQAEADNTGSFDTHAKDPQVELAKKSPEEIEKILFDDSPSTVSSRGPSPYIESEQEKAKRLEWEERDRRQVACTIAARLHQGRGLNMQDFLDEADVIVEYIRDGYIQDYRA